MFKFLKLEKWKKAKMLGGRFNTVRNSHLFWWKQRCQQIINLSGIKITMFFVTVIRYILWKTFLWFETKSSIIFCNIKTWIQNNREQCLTVMHKIRNSDVRNIIFRQCDRARNSSSWIDISDSHKYYNDDNSCDDDVGNEDETGIQMIFD